MTPPTPRLRPIPLPQVRGGPPLYPPPLPSPPASSAIALNPILKRSSPPQLYYDVSRPPTTAIFDPYMPFILATPATTPALASFRIIPPMKPEWPVVVYNPRGVTVFDVLKALYRSFRTPISPSAWDELALPLVVSSPVVSPRAHSYDFPRTATLEHSTRRPEFNRRIDHLHGRTLFVGLDKGHGGPEEWILDTAAAPE